MTKLITAFRCFANAHKNDILRQYTQDLSEPDAKMNLVATPTGVSGLKM